MLHTDSKNVFTLCFRTTSLLAAGSALAHQTVRCSALNVEELRREGGLEALLEAISRCIPMIGLSSKPDDVPVQVSYFNRTLFFYLHCTDCFETGLPTCV